MLGRKGGYNSWRGTGYDFDEIEALFRHQSRLDLPSSFSRRVQYLFRLVSAKPKFAAIITIVGTLGFLFVVVCPLTPRPLALSSNHGTEVSFLSFGRRRFWRLNPSTSGHGKFCLPTHTALPRRSISHHCRIPGTIDSISPARGCVRPLSYSIAREIGSLSLRS